jgi:hypothetical protein
MPLGTLSEAQPGGTASGSGITRQSVTFSSAEDGRWTRRKTLFVYGTLNMPRTLFRGDLIAILPGGMALTLK